MAISTDPVGDYAIAWWKKRHDAGYFPNMDVHADWKIQETMPDWFIVCAQPMPLDLVLDVGCGYGEHMIPMSRLVRFIAGIDIHQSLIDKAVEKFVQHSVQNAKVALGNGRILPYSDMTFTLVYSLGVFYHIPRCIVYNYLSESYRVLQSSGRAVMQFLSTMLPGYVDDIGIGHTGEWSVGWTIDQVSEAASCAGFLDHSVLDCGDTLVLIGRK